MSPLLLAAMWGKAEAVKALLIGGCELNTTDKDGRSAVFWAAQEGHMDVLRVRLCMCNEGVFIVCVRRFIKKSSVRCEYLWCVCVCAVCIIL